MKKFLSFITMLFISITISGCGDIKFIEKVEPEKSEVSTEEQFGSIIIEEPSEKTTEKQTKNTPSEDTETETTENSEQSESIEEPDGTFEYAGVKFKKDGGNATMWVKEDCPAKTKPSMEAEDYSFLHKGDFVTLSAVSSDEKWAMVSIYGGPSSFVEYKNLTYEEVSGQSQVGALETEEPSETESTESAESENQSQISESTSEQTTEQPSSSQQEEPSYSYESEPPVVPEPDPDPEPVDDYQGIAFPSNASSTSFNMGVEFADVTITLTVRKDSTQVSNGPAAPSNSSGYYSMATLSSGNTVKCTGIGRNGFVRVDYNGSVGFIDSRNVEY